MFTRQRDYSEAYPSVDEEEPSFLKDSLQIRSKEYLISAHLTDQRLKVSLMDTSISAIYEKQYTQSDVGYQIKEPMTLEDIFISLKCSADSTNRNQNAYQYQDSKKYYKIHKKGEFSVKMSLKDKRTNKQRSFQSLLTLNLSRKMSDAELIQHKMKWQIQSLAEQLKRQKAKSKNQREELIKKLEQTQQKLEQCLQKLKKLQTKLQQKQQKPCDKVGGKNQTTEEREKCQSKENIKEEQDSIVEIIKDMSPKNLQRVTKRSSAVWDIEVYPTHTTSFAKIFNNSYRCSIGRAGPSAFTRQGDDTTPIGTFPLRQIWYRPDRTTKQIYDLLIQTGLPVRPITVNDGWCDEPKSPYYNKHVDLRTFDKSVSHQNLWLESSSYDCLIVMGFNDDPVIPNRGSAIFIHVARASYVATAGCVAFSKDDLWEIMKYLKPYSQITVYDYQDKAKIKYNAQ